MISYLHGRPMLDADSVTIVVGGVGYGVHVNDQTKASLSTLTDAELFIYTHVREEALELYGFLTKPERQLFLLLLSVSGIGPKTALTMLNHAPNQIITAVQNADTSFFSGIPRVGKKLAQKIIIDLRTKLGALKELDLGPVSQQRQDVVMALQGLGFAESDIERALQELNVEEISLSEAVKQGIKLLGKKL